MGEYLTAKLYRVFDKSSSQGLSESFSPALGDVGNLNGIRESLLSSAMTWP
jgi:hypothetical protein